MLYLNHRKGDRLSKSTCSLAFQGRREVEEMKSRKAARRKEKELKRSERISLAIAVAPLVCIVLEFVIKLFL